MSKAIPLPVIRRLPRYYRYLYHLRYNAGLRSISSNELAQRMGTTPSQVRQDFNNFGTFGQQGVGYDIDTLIEKMGIQLFGADGKPLTAVLIGAGKLGGAIANFIANDTNGFQLLAAFDKSEALTGKQVGGAEILPMATFESYCEEHLPDIAVICVPRNSAEELVSTLHRLSFRAFWNFSQYDLALEFPNQKIENVHLGDSLMSLGYLVRNNY